ncbi:hypothetical protein WJX73_010703 [Symbiochloris irregularis]|uniref:Protein kinase domain-containing protein n=1 Tax=Symbiochloris irregularis TaxID=706552 RepID=A0AAW1P2M5_9CHLO
MGRKALLVGINYIGSEHQLNGCINDIHNVLNFLTRYAGWPTDANSLVILADDRPEPQFKPTRQNMINAMQWLTAGARPGDSLFFHYSGHGGTVKDPTGQEEKGYDSTICTIFDLPFSYRPNEDGEITMSEFATKARALLFDWQQVMNSKDVRGRMDAGMHMFQGGKELWNAVTHRGEPGQDWQETNHTHGPHGAVFCWSGCKDDQTSADATISGQASGAMSWALITTLEQQPDQTYAQILQNTRHMLLGKYTQIPQLAVGQKCNLDIPMRLLQETSPVLGSVLGPLYTAKGANGTGTVTPAPRGSSDSRDALSRGAERSSDEQGSAAADSPHGLEQAASRSISTTEADFGAFDASAELSSETGERAAPDQHGEWSFGKVERTKTDETAARRTVCQNSFIVPSESTGGNEEDLRDQADDEQDLCSLLISLQDHHWRIRSADLEVLLKADGSDWLLGKGGHASVYRGILNNSVPVAIKELADEESQSAKKSFVEEIVCLMNLRHANIVQFYGAVIESGKLLLVMELVMRGSLFDVISRDKDGQLTWYNRGAKIAADVARGLMHMHRNGFVHQDLKSKNILVNQHWTAKIADIGLFGSVAKLPHSSIRPEGKAFVGTLEWTAPEVLQGGQKQVTFKSDIYSFGVVLAEIISGEHPNSHDIPQFSCPEQCPPEISDLAGHTNHSGSTFPVSQPLCNAIRRAGILSRGEPGQDWQETNHTHRPHGAVFCWSGCKDDQTSADATISGQASGAMSWALITTLEQQPDQTYA